MKVTESKLSDKNLAILTSVYANNLENSVDRALWEWTQAQDSIDPQQLSDSCPRIDEIPFDGIKNIWLSIMLRVYGPKAHPMYSCL